MRENLRSFIYVLVAFLLTLEFAFIMLNNILAQSYFVWFSVVIGFTVIFSVSYIFLIIERKT